MQVPWSPLWTLLFFAVGACRQLRFHPQPLIADIGVEASWIGLSLNDGLTRAITTASHQRDRAQRSSAALGLGYFLNPRTVLSFDIAGGTSPAATSRTEISTGDLVQTGLQNSRFISTNVGVQRKVSSNLFLNASLLGIWQAYNLSQTVYPDATGNALPITDPFLPMTATGYRPPRVPAFWERCLRETFRFMSGQNSLRIFAAMSTPS